MDCIAPASFTHTRTSLRPSVVEMDCIAPASFTHTRTSPSTPYPDFLRSYNKNGSFCGSVQRLGVRGGMEQAAVWEPARDLAGVGLQMACGIDGHWLRKAAMDHYRAGLAMIGVGGVVGLKRREDSNLGTAQKASLATGRRREKEKSRLALLQDADAGNTKSPEESRLFAFCCFGVRFSAEYRDTPKGTRTPVLAVRGLCPRPLDDGGLLVCVAGVRSSVKKRGE
jgi:hypothetical protein